MSSRALVHKAQAITLQTLLLLLSLPYAVKDCLSSLQQISLVPDCQLCWTIG